MIARAGAIAPLVELVKLGTEEENAEDRPDDLALPAEEAGAADTLCAVCDHQRIEACTVGGQPVSRGRGPGVVPQRCCAGMQGGSGDGPGALIRHHDLDPQRVAGDIRRRGDSKWQHGSQRSHCRFSAGSQASERTED